MLMLNAETNCELCFHKDLGCLTLGHNQVQGWGTKAQLGTVAPDPIFGFNAEVLSGKVWAARP